MSRSRQKPKHSRREISEAAAEQAAAPYIAALTSLHRNILGLILNGLEVVRKSLIEWIGNKFLT